MVSAEKKTRLLGEIRLKQEIVEHISMHWNKVEPHLSSMCRDGFMSKLCMLTFPH